MGKPVHDYLKKRAIGQLDVIAPRVDSLRVEFHDEFIDCTPEPDGISATQSVDSKVQSLEIWNNIHL